MRVCIRVCMRVCVPGHVVLILAFIRTPQPSTLTPQPSTLTLSTLNPQLSTLLPQPSPLALGLDLCMQDLLADLAGSHSFCEFNIEKRLPLKIEHLALYKNDLKPALSKEEKNIAKKARSVERPGTALITATTSATYQISPPPRPSQTTSLSTAPLLGSESKLPRNWMVSNLWCL